jgi:ABC-type molybdate transport system ATPase subunit
MSSEAPTPGATVLFGPSGAGKPTITSAVAGLLHPDECRIRVMTKYWPIRPVLSRLYHRGEGHSPFP